MSETVQPGVQQGRSGTKMIHMLESSRNSLVKILTETNSKPARQFRQWQLDGLDWVLTDYRERFENASTVEELETVFQDIHATSVPQHEYGVEFVQYRMWLAG